MGEGNIKNHELEAKLKKRERKKKENYIKNWTKGLKNASF